MLLEAAEDFDLDLVESFIIGDKTSDIAAGETVGCIGIKVETVKRGEGGGEGNPSPIRTKHFVKRLDDAAKVVERYIKKESLIRDEYNLPVYSKERS